MRQPRYSVTLSWNSIKNTWKGLKSILNIKNIFAEIPKTLTVDGTTIANPMEISNIFLQLSLKQNLIFLKNRSNISFFVRPADKTETENVISSLDSNKSVGPNSIPTKILKLLKNYISSQLYEIFNISFSAGVFPSIPKSANLHI